MNNQTRILPGDGEDYTNQITSSVVMSNGLGTRQLVVRPDQNRVYLRLMLDSGGFADFFALPLGAATDFVGYQFGITEGGLEIWVNRHSSLCTGGWVTIDQMFAENISILEVRRVYTGSSNRQDDNFKANAIHGGSGGDHSRWPRLKKAINHFVATSRRSRRTKNGNIQPRQ